MTEQQAHQLVERYLEAYNLFEVAGMLSGLHPDVTFENVANDTVTLRTAGKAAFAAQAEQAIAWFTERNQHVQTFRFRDGRAEVDVDYFGIVAIDLPNGLKAGTELRLTGRSVFTFRDGLIASIQDVN